MDYSTWRASMYAVVKSGGKEYKISKGDLLRVEKIPGKVGDEVTLKDVLMVSDGDQVHVGTPLLPNAVVTGEIVQTVKGKKILIYKMKRRKNYRRTKGHRQTYTYIRVKEIGLAG
jgi:large subunit ribosomal protein L21